MPRKFTNWLQAQRARLQGRTRQGKPEEHDEPPPIVRPWTMPGRTGAVSPTHFDAESGATPSRSTANSGFFQKLPAEIRRKILIAAFGGQTVHMSLEFGHPKQLVRAPVSATNPIPWPLVRYMPPTAKWPPQDLFPDPEAPKAWQWRGCACWDFSRCGPAHDCCLPGVVRCWENGSDPPGICVIGAFGWLLACRQAYLEGIEVLYSTNTIRMTNWNDVIVSHLGDLLSPHRLAMITSIELKWLTADLTGPASSREGRKRGRPEFLAMLSAIPSTLPNLRSVHLYIEAGFPGIKLAERALLYDQYLFEPVDDMVRRLGPQLREFILLVPYTVASKRLAHAAREGFKIERRRDWQEVFFWRPLPPLEDETGASLGRRLKESPDSGNVCGYWVTQGYYDNPYPQMGCFGSGSTDPELHDAIFKELNS